MKPRILDLIRMWPARLGLRPVGIALFCALVALVWLADHDAQVRQASELADLRKRAGAEISSLKAKAESARRDADQQRAQAIRGLQARQAELARAGEQLRQRLAALQQEERKQVEQAATLPTSEVATRVAARLGLPTPSLPAQAGLREAGLPAGKSEIPNSKSEIQKSAAGQELRLDESAERKLAADLARLDACKEQSAVLNQQSVNCNQQVATQAALIRQQSASIQDFHQALADQDRLIEQLKKEHQAELKAVRGTRWHRIVRTLEHVAIGMAIGAAIR